MKKKVFMMLVIILTIYPFIASAQHISYPKFHLGVRAGYTFNNVTGKQQHFEYYSCSEPISHNSIYGGVSMDFRITPFPLYLETGAYWMNRKYSYVADITVESVPSTTMTVKDDFFHIPLLFSYHFYLNDNMAIQPFAGGYGGYLRNSESFGYGVRLGCGVNYRRFYANVGYDIDLSKHKWNKYKVDHFNALFITLGYNIIGGL